MESLGEVIEKGLSLGESSSVLMSCEVCGERVEKVVNIFNKAMKVRVICSCKKNDILIKEKRERDEEKKRRLRSIMKNSLMEESFFFKTFENWDVLRGDKRLLTLGKKYVDGFFEVKREGLGLLITGGGGNGKSYLSFSIANELLKRGVPVICISINGLLERIRETYNSLGRDGEWQVIGALKNAELLVIDDLGTEQSTEWSASKVFTIIDSRYRNKLPTIITTNLNVEMLSDRYGERTIDRVIEMCTIIEHKGESLRQGKALENTEKLRNLLYGRGINE